MKPLVRSGVRKTKTELCVRMIQQGQLWPIVQSQQYPGLIPLSKQYSELITRSQQYPGLIPRSQQYPRKIIVV